MVMMVVMLLLPPLPVLAPAGATGAVAALLVAAVPPLPGQRRRCGLVLQVRLLQDWRRAQLFTQRLGGLVVDGGGDLSDLAAGSQAGRGGDAHNGSKSGDGDLVLERAGVALRPVMTL